MNQKKPVRKKSDDNEWRLVEEYDGKTGKKTIYPELSKKEPRNRSDKELMDRLNRALKKEVSKRFDDLAINGCDHIYSVSSASNPDHKGNCSLALTHESGDVRYLKYLPCLYCLLCGAKLETK